MPSTKLAARKASNAQANRDEQLADQAAIAATLNETLAFEPTDSDYEVEGEDMNRNGTVTNEEITILTFEEMQKTLPQAQTVTSVGPGRGQGTRPVDTSSRDQRGDLEDDVPGQKDGPRHKLANIVVISPQPRWNDTVTVYGTLDRLNPDLVFHGATNGVDNMARDWAISRGKQHIPMSADWDGLGAAAGPIRNGEMLEAARKIVYDTTDEKLRAALVYSDTGVGYDRDRVTTSMLSTNANRNTIYAQQPGLQRCCIHAINAHEWMSEDALASNPITALGIAVDLPVPSSVR